MKKIIEKALLTVFILAFFAQTTTAQPKKPGTKSKPVTTNIQNAETVNIGTDGVQVTEKKENAKNKLSVKDSIPSLADTANFINNADLVQLNIVMRRVLTSEQYKQAGDPISQYEVLVTYMNQVFIAARNRWEQKNKFKMLPAEPAPIGKKLN